MVALDGRADRAAGALAGLALGDALGMSTQSLPRDQLVARHGGPLTTLVDAPSDQPIARGLLAGRVTDDTEQTVLLAGLIVSGDGVVDPHAWIAALDSWDRDLAARGSSDLLGPSTRRAIDAVRAGTPVAEAGRAGTTNGAAMRAAPLGVAAPVDDLDAFVAYVVAACRPTHHTSLATAGACAVAAAVSAGVDGASTDDALDVALMAARRAERVTPWAAGALVSARLEWALGLARSTTDPDRFDDLVARLVGTSVAAQESVPAALAYAVRDAAPLDLLGRTAVLGGDTDTVAAMLGAVLGACRGRRALPADLLATVEHVNGLDLASLAEALLGVRDGGGALR